MPTAAPTPSVALNAASRRTRTSAPTASRFRFVLLPLRSHAGTRAPRCSSGRPSCPRSAWRWRSRLTSVQRSATLAPLVPSPAHVFGWQGDVAALAALAEKPYADLQASYAGDQRAWLVCFSHPLLLLAAPEYVATFMDYLKSPQ